jgi:hypothetical protein
LAGILYFEYKDKTAAAIISAVIGLVFASELVWRHEMSAGMSIGTIIVYVLAALCLFFLGAALEDIDWDSMEWIEITLVTASFIFSVVWFFLAIIGSQGALTVDNSLLFGWLENFTWSWKWLQWAVPAAVGGILLYFSTGKLVRVIAGALLGFAFAVHQPLRLGNRAGGDPFDCSNGASNCLRICIKIQKELLCGFSRIRSFGNYSDDHCLVEPISVSQLPSWYPANLRHPCSG